MKDTVVGDVTVAGRMFDDRGVGDGCFKYVKVECQLKSLQPAK
jgi:hypothetical protein